MVATNPKTHVVHSPWLVLQAFFVVEPPTLNHVEPRQSLFKSYHANQINSNQITLKTLYIISKLNLIKSHDILWNHTKSYLKRLNHFNINHIQSYSCLYVWFQLSWKIHPFHTNIHPNWATWGSGRAETQGQEALAQAPQEVDGLRWWYPHLWWKPEAVIHIDDVWSLKTSKNHTMNRFNRNFTI